MLRENMRVDEKMEIDEVENAHPLTNLMELYCDEYERLREDHLDLPHITFHRTYGLSVQIPEGWNVLGSVKDVVNSFAPAHKIVTIFSTTAAYKKIHNCLGDRIHYLSWHEIFTGMHVAQTDVRYMQRAKQVLGDADLVFFLNPPALPEVVDQVRGQSGGALIILSGGGIDV